MLDLLTRPRCGHVCAVLRLDDQDFLAHAKEAHAVCGQRGRRTTFLILADAGLELADRRLRQLAVLLRDPTGARGPSVRLCYGGALGVRDAMNSLPEVDEIAAFGADQDLVAGLSPQFRSLD